MVTKPSCLVSEYLLYTIKYRSGYFYQQAGQHNAGMLPALENFSAGLLHLTKHKSRSRQL